MLDDTIVLEDGEPFSALLLLASRINGGIRAIAADIDLEVKRAMELWPPEKGKVEGHLVWMLSRYAREMDDCRALRREFQDENDRKAAERSEQQ